VKKSPVLNSITFIGLVNILWLSYYIYTTEDSYLVANIPPQFLKIILVFLPVLLTLISVVIFFIDLIIYKEKNWHAFLPAFIALIPDARFVIGSLYFGQH
jgi:hypothetical protein